jgi:rRNA maturation RNase YbeY
MKRDGSLSLSNHQRTKKVRIAALRNQLEAFLKKELPTVVAEKARRKNHRPVQFDILVHLVDAVRMTALNERWLRHKGSTDVITFDFASSMEGGGERSATPPWISEDRGTDTQAFTRSQSAVDADTLPAHSITRDAPIVCGEIFVCVDEAVAQAPRFRTTWHDEMVRYILHGVLHLVGYDDRSASKKRKMKGAEDRLVSRWKSHNLP